ncbi:hypothetical protein CKM354_000986300 [Cercospora kikuchii]|uniref:PH-response regulator protein palH/RIM21 n=1 Tax=Cercospora kikuchii TaxID=84275 RepID=A0A9P3CVZ1_9PEZI|nr:uncharacterized protein CKM354_000986300 [Cercospora kikuchii]GIZ46750.1 hypothetical protein CKM354_000986300 [Cercospora kikuchii]
MFHDVAQVQPRQLWNLPTITTTNSLAHCTPFTLPSAGVLSLGDDTVITLTTDVIFQPECTGGPQAGDVFTVDHLRDPFYASTIPMVYVVSAATVIAWVLVIMLTITPRTGFFGAPGAPAFSNGHGIIGGANGGVMGVTGTGSRPWLQKIAALAVAISLTIATADTLDVAEKQYGKGYSDANLLRKEVLGSLEIRITRVVSDIFLWLAQVQTLIRLFPRHREKVLIKWIGFVLIMFDTIFSCLNSFLINSALQGRNIVDAIPALSYLFELALGLLYAAWVLYYSLTKRRYAFYHPKMRNILLVAFLSIVSILTPVVFFITDVSNQDVAGWGDYFRWVGAAAASVVVWEWVERIEALERDDKKDGILGREIFDGDEMLDVIPDQDVAWSESRNLRRNFRRRRDDGPDGGGNTSSAMERGHGLHGVTQRFRSRHQQSPSHFPLGRAHSASVPTSRDNIRPGDPTDATGQNNPILGGPTPPPQVASPVSRTDTTSAASTVYVVRYHPIADVPQPIRRRANPERNATTRPAAQRRRTENQEYSEKDIIEGEEDVQPNINRGNRLWNVVPNPFKRKRTSPPTEVQRARQAAGQRVPTPGKESSRWDVRNRLGTMASEAGEKVREKTERRPEPDLPVTVIPAQPRGSNRTWSPVEQTQRMNVLRPIDPDQRPPASHGSDQSGDTGSTTLTANSQPVRSSQRPAVQRGDHGAANAVIATQSPVEYVSTSRNGPPRADDISPVNGRNAGTIVVPAPPRRTPTLQTNTPPIRNGASRNSGMAPSGSNRNTPSNDNSDAANGA